MAALVLDAGALIAVDRDDRESVAMLRVAALNGIDLRSNGAVIAQAWREDGGRQARLARLLKAVEVVAVNDSLGRQAGVLLGKAGTSDPVDGTVVAIALSGDRIVTSDAGDIAKLVAASGRAIGVVGC